MAKKKLLIAAFLVGAFAALLMWLYVDQVKQKQQSLLRDEVEVVKAARDIPAGTPLTSDRITTEEVPARFLPPNPLRKKEVSIYLGTPLAVNVKENAMILTSDFAVTQVSRNLSSKIPKHERAMSLPVDSVSGVSELLRPGDRVDILGTFPVGTKNQVIPEAGGAKQTGYVTMTLLQNVTLLAVGQQISNASNGDDNPRRNSYSTVTVSVTIDEAELLTIAQTRGKLSLLLRHQDDMDIGTIQKKTLRGVLEDLEVINRERQKRIVHRHKKPGIIINRGDQGP